jgi:hypothetical protein
LIDAYDQYNEKYTGYMGTGQGLFEREFRFQRGISSLKWAILIFSSPELKAQVSFSDCPLSGICLSVRL